MRLLTGLIALMPAFIVVDGSSPSPSEIRKQFIADVLSKPEFSTMRNVMTYAALKTRRPVHKKPSEESAARVAKQQLSMILDHALPGAPAVATVNRPIADLLYQGDMLVDNEQASMMASDAGARRRRQAFPGDSDPKSMWSPDTPISYYFDETISPELAEKIRLSIQYYEENTCLSFAENATAKPRVKFFKGEGCYSTINKGTTDRDRIISIGLGCTFGTGDRDRIISIGLGCTFFNIITHEIGHTLGLMHEMSRYDRDDWIEVQYDNLKDDWLRSQFGKSTPEESTNLGIAYDYGSVMHYTAYSTDGKTLEVLAKRKEYQHTMGNFYGPVFKDLLMLNRFYRCTGRCSTGAQCKNAGFRHPRDCHKCICPNGFGGADCSQRQAGENGAPEDCGGTVTATSEYQYLSGKVSSGRDIVRSSSPYYNIWRPKACHYHIQAPAGKRIELTVESVTGPCSPECSYGGTEVKFDNLTRVGARLCCPSHLADVGTVKTTGELAIVSVLSGQSEHGFRLRYRLAESPSPPPSTSGPTHVPEVRDDCADRLGYCYQYGLFCDDANDKYDLRQHCPHSCGFCRAPSDPVPVAGTCVDIWPHCKMDAWKSWCGYGDNGRYADYMVFLKAKCARTCGFCTDSKQ